MDHLQIRLIPDILFHLTEAPAATSMSKRDNMADKQLQVENFMKVTGCDKERSQFFLEAAAWNLEVSFS